MPEAPSNGQAPWVVVAPAFHDRGGMEKANAALARYLGKRGVPVHLVGHSVAADLRNHPLVTFHPVPRPLDSFLLGEWLLGVRGRSVARAVTARHRGTRVVVNGGNCNWGDINWIHCVHHAWPCVDAGAPLWFRVKNRLVKAYGRWAERRIIPRARVVLANSLRTRTDLIERLGIDGGKIHTVYLGSEEDAVQADAAARSAARDWLGLESRGPVVAFVGALGHDQNKGMDTLLRAWKMVCEDPRWDGELVAAGGGVGLERWIREAERLGIAGRVHFLGFTDRVPSLLAAADLLVSPSRYDAYGLGVQEAICRGVPAAVTGRAGVAERYPPHLRSFVLQDPESPEELAELLMEWRGRMGEWREQFAPLGTSFRAHRWVDMAEEIVAIAGYGEQNRTPQGFPATIG